MSTKKSVMSAMSITVLIVWVIMSVGNAFRLSISKITILLVSAMMIPTWWRILSVFVPAQPPSSTIHVWSVRWRIVMNVSSQMFVSAATVGSIMLMELVSALIPSKLSITLASALKEPSILLTNVNLVGWLIVRFAILLIHVESVCLLLSLAAIKLCVLAQTQPSNSKTRNVFVLKAPHNSTELVLAVRLSIARSARTQGFVPNARKHLLSIITPANVLIPS